jgi:hypothetical protein
MDRNGMVPTRRTSAERAGRPRRGSSRSAVTVVLSGASPLATVPFAAAARAPRRATAVKYSGHLMFGPAAAADAWGLVGLAHATGLLRRS